MPITPSLLLFILAISISCQPKQKPAKENSDDKAALVNKPSNDQPYQRKWVDDIAFDPEIDDANFNVCYGDNKIIQYFNNSLGVEYEGEKTAIDQAFKEQYDASQAARESGSVRIRFIVNCEGNTGRFRILGIDEAYQQTQFDASITDQLLAITKSLEGWKPKTERGRSVDYYQYLLFKIQDGKIVNILP